MKRTCDRCKCEVEGKRKRCLRCDKMLCRKCVAWWSGPTSAICPECWTKEGRR